MAIDIILRRPVGDHRIGDGVEARQPELADEQFPIVALEGRELIEIVANNNGVEPYQGQQHGEGHLALVATDAEKIDQVSHRFKKNLTNRKFTGTQTQNIGTGASCRLTPNQSTALSTTICNK